MTPGTRIGSHNYDMNEWQADNFKKIGLHEPLFLGCPGQCCWDMGLGDREGYGRYAA